MSSRVGHSYTQAYQSFTLKKQYIRLIQSGRKTIEGRINTGGFARLRVGDKVRFFYMQNATDDARCTITAIKVYRSFKEMLETDGTENFLPGTKSIEEGVRAYDAIPGYNDKVQRFGAIALHLRLDTPGTEDYSSNRGESRRTHEETTTKHRGDLRELIAKSRESEWSSRSEPKKRSREDDEGPARKKTRTDGALDAVAPLFHTEEKTSSHREDLRESLSKSREVERDSYSESRKRKREDDEDPSPYRHSGREDSRPESRTRSREGDETPSSKRVRREHVDKEFSGSRGDK